MKNQTNQHYGQGQQPAPVPTGVWAALRVQETIANAKRLAVSEWRRRADELQFQAGARR